MNNPLFFTLLLLTSYGGYDKIYLERRNVMSIKTIKRDIAELKSLKLISRKGSTHGKWVVLDKWLK